MAELDDRKSYKRGRSSSPRIIRHFVITFSYLWYLWTGDTRELALEVWREVWYETKEKTIRYVYRAPRWASLETLDGNTCFTGGLNSWVNFPGLLAWFGDILQEVDTLRYCIETGNSNWRERKKQFESSASRWLGLGWRAGGYEIKKKSGSSIGG